MQARLIKDEYNDLCLGFPYTIKRVMSRGHIMLEGSPRRYTASSFEITHKGKKITYAEAYRVYKVESTMQKLGIK